MTAARSRAGSLLRDRRVIGAVLAAIVFLGSWSLLGEGFYSHGRISDTAVYNDYGLKMRNGLLPYRDFPVEYPPASLPTFLVPTYVGQPTDLNDYSKWFGRLMAVCGLVALGLVLLAGAPWWGVALVAVSPLLVGHLMLDRFDLWPVALMAGGIAALVRDRHRIGWLALGCAVAAKLFAVVLLPLAAVWTYRRRARAELTRGAAIWAAAVAAIVAPFAIVAPRGVWDSVWGQLSRPIQIESLAGSYLIRFKSPTIVVSHDALAIRGYGTLATVTTVVEIACLAGLWIAFARGPAEETRFARYAAACVCAFVAFGKVLSPQFLIWLVPLVALVRGARGLAAAALLAAAAIDTQYFFRSDRYGRYIHQLGDATPVLARNVLLVALVALLAAPVIHFPGRSDKH
jgi:uncharacterized membrane protein